MAEEKKKSKAKPFGYITYVHETILGPRTTLFLFFPLVAPKKKKGREDEEEEKKEPLPVYQNVHAHLVEWKSLETKKKYEIYRLLGLHWIELLAETWIQEEHIMRSWHGVKPPSLFLPGITLQPRGRCIQVEDIGDIERYLFDKPFKCFRTCTGLDELGIPRIVSKYDEIWKHEIIPWLHALGHYASREGPLRDTALDARRAFIGMAAGLWSYSFHQALHGYHDRQGTLHRLYGSTKVPAFFWGIRWEALAFPDPEEKDRDFVPLIARYPLPAPSNPLPLDQVPPLIPYLDHTIGSQGFRSKADPESKKTRVRVRDHIPLCEHLLSRFGGYNDEDIRKMRRVWRDFPGHEGLLFNVLAKQIYAHRLEQAHHNAVLDADQWQVSRVEKRPRSPVDHGASMPIHRMYAAHEARLKRPNADKREVDMDPDEVVLPPTRLDDIDPDMIDAQRANSPVFGISERIEISATYIEEPPRIDQSSSSRLPDAFDTFASMDLSSASQLPDYFNPLPSQRNFLSTPPPASDDYTDAELDALSELYPPVRRDPNNPDL